MKKKDEVEEWLFATCAFGLSAPYFFWGLPLNGILFLLSTVLVFRNWNLPYEISKIRIYIPMFILLYLWVALRSNFTFFGILTVSLFWTLFSAKSDFLSHSFKKYKTIFAISLIPSILIYVLFLFGYELSYNTVEPINEIKEGFYRIYPFTIIYEGIPGFPMLRFHAYYDEPGIVGTISAILLIIDNVNIKNKINIPILLAGILSLSLFFYVILLAYLFVFAKPKYKLIGGVIILFGGLLFITIVGQDFPFFQRFIVENGKFVGDTRTSDSFEVWYSNFLSSIDVWFGYGGNKAQTINVGGSSYKDLVVNYGAIFFIFYILSFIAYIGHYCKSRYSRLVCVFLFLCTLYQRPAIYDYFYLFLWCGMICSLQQKTRTISIDIAH